MNIFGSFEGKIKEWLLQTALKKALKRLVIVLGTFLASKQALLAGWGLNLSITDPGALELSLFSGAYLLLEVGRNFLKHRVGLRLP